MENIGKLRWVFKTYGNYILETFKPNMNILLFEFMTSYRED